MNKIAKIVILAFIAVVLTGIMIILIEDKDNHYLNIFNYKKELILEKEYNSEEINSFDITSDSSDVTIKKSDANVVSIKIYGDKKDEATTSVKDNTLYINNDNSTNICLFFCFVNSKIEVLVPKLEYNNLKVKIASGDIDIEDINIEDVSINSKSGDIKLNKATKANLDLVSGDIEFNEIDEANLVTISGDIKGNITNKINARTKSGDIKLANINDSGDILVTSGDIFITNLNIINNSILKTVSGDITINKTNDVYFEAKAISGNINIDNNNRFSKIEVKVSTTSGDINIS